MTTSVPFIPFFVAIIVALVAISGFVPTDMAVKKSTTALSECGSQLRENVGDKLGDIIKDTYARSEIVLDKYQTFVDAFGPPPQSFGSDFRFDATFAKFMVKDALSNDNVYFGNDLGVWILVFTQTLLITNGPINSTHDTWIRGPAVNIDALHLPPSSDMAAAAQPTLNFTSMGLNRTVGPFRLGTVVTERPWYKATPQNFTLAKFKSYPTNCYVFAGSPAIGVTLTKPLFDKATNRSLGVIAQDFELSDLSSIFTEFAKETGMEYVAVIEADTYRIIGTSYNGDVPFVTDEKGKVSGRLLDIRQSNSAPLKALGAVLTPNMKGGEYEFEDILFTIGRAEFNTAKWITIVGKRRANALHSVDEIKRYSYSLVGGLTAASIVLAALLCGVMYYTMSKVLLRMGQIATMDIEGVAPYASKWSASVCRELSTVGQLLLVISHNLKAYKSYMPQSLFTGGGEETELVFQDKESSKPPSQTRPEKQKSDRGSMSSYSEKAAVFGDLRKKDMTLVHGSLSNFMDTVYSKGITQVGQFYDSLINSICVKVKDTHGVVERVCGDHFIVSFNAAKANTSHATSGAQFALGLAHAFEKFLPDGSATLIVSTGNMLVGAVGRDEFRTFVLHSKEVDEAVMGMARLLSSPGPKVLAFGDTNALLTNMVSSIPIDFVSTRANKKKVVYLLLGLHNDTKNEEWMYTLQQHEFQQHAAAIEDGLLEYCEKGQVQKAVTALNTYLFQNPPLPKTALQALTNLRSKLAPSEKN